MQVHLVNILNRPLISKYPQSANKYMTRIITPALVLLWLVSQCSAALNLVRPEQGGQRASIQLPHAMKDLKSVNGI